MKYAADACNLAERRLRFRDRHECIIPKVAPVVLFPLLLLSTDLLFPSKASKPEQTKTHGLRNVAESCGTRSSGGKARNNDEKENVEPVLLVVPP